MPCAHFKFKHVFVIMAAATAVLLFLLLVLSTPIIKSISFGSTSFGTTTQSRATYRGTITFGALGYCSTMNIVPPSDTNASSALASSHTSVTNCSTNARLIYALDDTHSHVRMGKVMTRLGVLYLTALIAAIIVCISSAFRIVTRCQCFWKFVVFLAAVVAVLCASIALVIDLIFINSHFKKHDGSIAGICLPCTRRKYQPSEKSQPASEESMGKPRLAYHLPTDTPQRTRRIAQYNLNLHNGMECTTTRKETDSGEGKGMERLMATFDYYAPQPPSLTPARNDDDDDDRYGHAL